MEINLNDKKPDIRHLSELEKVVYDTEWFAGADKKTELYYMYRSLAVENGLRYDVTIIPSRTLGKEFVKTKGHIHAGFYGEVYMVLEGEGMYFSRRAMKNVSKMFLLSMPKKMMLS